MAVISGDGVFSHVFLGADDVAASAKFYDAALGALGVNNLGPFGNGWILYGKDKPAFIIAKPGNGEASSSNGATVGFAAATTSDVDAFHAADIVHEFGEAREVAPPPINFLPGQIDRRAPADEGAFVTFGPIPQRPLWRIAD